VTLSARSPLLRALSQPSQAAALGLDDWARALASARYSSLLPRLSLLMPDETMAQLPARVRAQLEAARPIAAQHERTIRWEIACIERALRPLRTKIVVLKGAAYVLAGLPAGRGRLATDVDILVPTADLRRVEGALVASGWAAVKLHPYDQRFYREWSHELPPLQHSRRRSVVDVHHNILPVSGRVHPSADALLATAVPLAVDGIEGTLWRLSPEDMVLHGAAHLFQDGELAGSVRDLVDTDALCRHFGATVPGFWEQLPQRARLHELERPLFYALRFARRLLDTPVPLEVDRTIRRPPAPFVAAMDRLVAQTLLPVTGQHATFGEESARWLLYVRSHWLRMPPHLLAAHLTRKALRRWGADKDEGEV
jgi:hypothetical protein